MKTGDSWPQLSRNSVAAWIPTEEGAKIVEDCSPRRFRGAQLGKLLGKHIAFDTIFPMSWDFWMLLACSAVLCTVKFQLHLISFKSSTLVGLDFVVTVLKNAPWNSSFVHLSYLFIWYLAEKRPSEQSRTKADVVCVRVCLFFLWILLFTLPAFLYVVLGTVLAWATSHCNQPCNYKDGWCLEPLFRGFDLSAMSVDWTLGLF